MTVVIRPLIASDWDAVEAIYREGIETGNATFDVAPPSWETFDATRRADLRLVAEVDDAVVGWAAASPVSARPVYAGVVEHSIYVAAVVRGKGVGGLLLDSFLRLADRQGVWTVQSSIFPENEATARLHEAAGFRVVGRRERIALMTYGPWADQWRDTVILERRV